MLCRNGNADNAESSSASRLPGARRVVRCSQGACCARGRLGLRPCASSRNAPHVERRRKKVLREEQGRARQANHREVARKRPRAVGRQQRLPQADREHSRAPLGPPVSAVSESLHRTNTETTISGVTPSFAFLHKPQAYLRTRAELGLCEAEGVAHQRQYHTAELCFSRHAWVSTAGAIPTLCPGSRSEITLTPKPETVSPASPTRLCARSHSFVLLVVHDPQNLRMNPVQASCKQ